MKILGIETASGKPNYAIVEDGRKIHSLTSTKISTDNLPDIDAIAFSALPNDDKSPDNGISFANLLNKKAKLPMIPVDPVHAHAYAPFIDKVYIDEDIQFPLLALVVTNGRTQLMHFPKNPMQYKVIGQTQDIGVGRLFDEVAQLLGLGDSQGAAIAQHSPEGDETTYDFPRPLMHIDTLDFSFAELQEAVRQHLQDVPANNHGVNVNQATQDLLNKYYRQDVAASFQQAVVDVLVAKTVKAAQDLKAKSVVLGGGVAANERLRNVLGFQLDKEPAELYLPSASYCPDHPAAIAGLAYHLQ